MNRPLLTGYLKRARANAVSKYITGNVLDIGCGDCQVLNLLKGKINNYYGLDNQYYIPESIIQLTKQYNIPFRFFKMDIEHEKLPEFDIKFDTIIMIAVIEHLKNPENIFNQISNYLTAEGRLIITTPTSFADKIHGLGSKLNIFSKEASEKHSILYDFDRMDTLVKRNRLTIMSYEKFEFGLNQIFFIKSNKLNE